MTTEVIAGVAVVFLLLLTIVFVSGLTHEPPEDWR